MGTDYLHPEFRFPHTQSEKENKLLFEYAHERGICIRFDQFRKWSLRPILSPRIPYWFLGSPSGNLEAKYPTW